MAGYYYLISSLPSLQAEVEPAIKLADFLELCAEWLSPAEMTTLNQLDLIPPEEETHPAKTVAAWHGWETSLRNALTRHRGTSGQDIDTALREEKDYYSEIDAAVQEAWVQTDPLEREKVLFRLRWNFLDELEGLHLFDFHLLCIYKLKLQLQERWQKFNAAIGRSNFAQTLEKIEHREPGIAIQ